MSMDNTRKQRFEKIFSMKSRDEFALNPKELLGYMMDLGFDRRDINMVWYLCHSSHDTLQKVIAGKCEIESVIDELSLKTRLNKQLLQTMFEDLAPRARIDN